MRNKNKSFKLDLQDAKWLKVGDVISPSPNTKAIIVKLYKDTWWKKILRKVGFKYKPYTAKVKNYDYNNR